MNNIEDIIKVSGIDCLFVGPYDLSASMGKIGLTTDPDVQNAIMQVKKCADKQKYHLGFLVLPLIQLLPCIQSGYTLLPLA